MVVACFIWRAEIVQKISSSKLKTIFNTFWCQLLELQWCLCLLNGSFLQACIVHGEQIFQLNWTISITALNFLFTNAKPLVQLTCYTYGGRWEMRCTLSRFRPRNPRRSSCCSLKPRPQTVYSGWRGWHYQRWSSHCWSPSERLIPQGGRLRCWHYCPQQQLRSTLRKYRRDCDDNVRIGVRYTWLKSQSHAVARKLLFCDALHTQTCSASGTGTWIKSRVKGAY